MSTKTPTGTKFTSSDASGTTTAYFDEIVYDETLLRELQAAQEANPRAKRCQCANPDCRAITRGGNFAPGHDAKMVKRLAYQVTEKTGVFAQFSMADARRNLYAAGGSDALMAKLVTKVQRAEGRLQGVQIAKPVRVAVRMTIEVTPEQAEALSREYGIETDPASIRTFVNEYVDNDAKGCPAGEFWTVVD